MFDLFAKSNFQNCSIALNFLSFAHGTRTSLGTRPCCSNKWGAMYAKPQSYQNVQSVASCLYQQLVCYLHSSWKNSKHKKFPKSIIKQFHKNLVCRKRDGNNGDREDNVLNMNNSQYLDYMYKAWLEDQKSVSSSWDMYFKLIHTKSSKDSRAISNSIRASSSSKLMTSNLEGGQSYSESALMSSI